MENIKRLAELIRQNGYPQSKGSFILVGMDGKVVAACAVGQAYLNAGNPVPPSGSDLFKVFSWAQNILDGEKHFTPVLCPIDDCEEQTDFLPYHFITHLNDDHYLPLKDIADYLMEAFYIED